MNTPKKPDLNRFGQHICVSSDTVLLFSDKELLGLLRRLGVDTSRPTYVEAGCGVFYTD